MNSFFDVKRNGTRFKVLLSVALVVAAFTSGSAQTGMLKSASQPDRASSAPAPSSGAVQNSYADVVGRVSPAVVTIRSTERARSARQFPFMDDPTFREFFGDRLPQQ